MIIRSKDFAFWERKKKDNSTFWVKKNLIINVLYNGKLSCLIVSDLCSASHIVRLSITFLFDCVLRTAKGRVLFLMSLMFYKHQNRFEFLTSCMQSCQNVIMSILKSIAFDYSKYKNVILKSNKSNAVWLWFCSSKNWFFHAVGRF